MSQSAGKVALITGGKAGIGRATAIEFAKQGAKVVVSARREQEGRDVVAEINALGGEAILVRADVSKECDVKAMVDRTLATFGRLGRSAARRRGNATLYHYYVSFHPLPSWQRCWRESTSYSIRDLAAEQLILGW